jgi:hypothetical protein
VLRVCGRRAWEALRCARLVAARVLTRFDK